MPFLRVKKVPRRQSSHKYEYVYEVENYREGNKIKQKTLRFLGRLVELNELAGSNQNIENLEEFESISDKERLIEHLATAILSAHGFKKSKKGFVKNKILIDLKNYSVKLNNRNVFIKLNDGYFGKYTLEKLREARSYEELIRWLVASGLVPKPKKFDESDPNFVFLTKLAALFKDKIKIKTISFEEFAKKVGY